MPSSSSKLYFLFITLFVNVWIAAPVAADDPDPLWRHDESWVSGFAIDAQDNVVFGADGLTRKLAPDGTVLWTRNFAWPTGHTILNWTAVDPDGNVIRSGYVDGGTYGFLVVKYDPDGNLLWSTLRDHNYGPESFRSEVDEFGGIYVFGEVRPTGTYKAFLTMKFDAAGQHAWSDVEHSGNEPRALVVKGGRVVGAGNGSSSFATVVYDYAGNKLWFDQYHPGNSGAFDVAVGPSGEVAVCGWGFIQGGPTGSYGTVLRYDAQGNRSWLAYYNSPYGGIEIFRKIAIGDDGAVVATGTGLSSADDAWSTVKFDASSGNVLWARLYDNVPWNWSSGYEYARSLLVSPSGSVYVGGPSQRTCSGLGMEGHVIKYTPHGDLEWAEALATPTNCVASFPHRLLRDSTGAIVSASEYELIKLREPAGSAYCSPAAVNSSGQPATVGATGSSIASLNELRLTARNLPVNAPGYFLVSRTQGFTANAGGSQGNLCLAGSIGRFANHVQSAGASGTMTLEIDLGNIPGSPPTAVAPGDTWNFQAWFRDANPQVTSNFTNAVSITYQ